MKAENQSPGVFPRLFYKFATSPDKHVDESRCVFTDEPQIGPDRYDRFVGVAFAPMAPGKYMYMGMAPAVGNSPAQFGAVVRLIGDYSAIGANAVKIDVRPTTANLRRIAGWPTNGIYEFSTHAHGVFELSFKLERGVALALHTNRARIEIPTGPGIGN
jgi:hypothetical protein